MKWSPPKAMSFFKVRKSDPQNTPHTPQGFAPLEGDRLKLKIRRWKQMHQLPERKMYFRSSHNSLQSIVDRYATEPWYSKNRILKSLRKLLVFTITFIGAWSILYEPAAAQWVKATKSTEVKVAQKINDKSYALNFLKQLRAQNQSRLDDINKKISQQLNRTQNIDASGLSSSFQNFENEINDLSQLFREHKLRQDFLNRLILQVEKYPGSEKGPRLREYVRVALLKMARIEATGEKPSSPMWRFMSYLAAAIKTLPERNENVMEFIEGYLSFSSISKPIRPDQYVSQRDYTDGTTNQKAQTVNAEQAGDFAETQVTRIHSEKAAQQKEQIFELRRPLLKDVTQEIDEKEISKARLEEWRVENPAPEKNQ